MAPKAQRQPHTSPTQAPIGMPSTEARLQPSSTKVMAWPRCAGGTITPSAAAACGVNTAADSTEMARTGSSAAKLGISAAMPCHTPNHSSAPVSSRRRSMPATTAANSGAVTAISTAATLISWPATATLTCSERARSFSVPAVTITPQPMLKLPASSAQRTPWWVAGARLTGSPSAPRG